MSVSSLQHGNGSMEVPPHPKSSQITTHSSIFSALSKPSSLSAGLAFHSRMLEEPTSPTKPGPLSSGRDTLHQSTLLLEFHLKRAQPISSRAVSPFGPAHSYSGPLSALTTHS